MSAAAVVEAVLAEVEAQLVCQGFGGSISVIDQYARVHINGTIDLPALVTATEQALFDSYGSPDIRNQG